MYDFQQYTHLPTIVVQDGRIEYTFVPALQKPAGVAVDYDLDEDDEDDKGDIGGNLSQYTLNVLFGKVNAQLSLGDEEVPIVHVNNEKYWNTTLTVTGEAIPASKVNQRTADAKMRREKLLSKQLSTAKERWSSWSKQAPAPKTLPPPPAPQPQPKPKPTVVHHAFKARTPPPIDFAKHPTLPLVTIKAADGTQHEFMINLAYKAERLEGNVTAYNLTTLFRLVSPLSLVTSKGSPVPYNQTDACFEVGLWELMDGPLVVSGTAKSVPEDPKQAAHKEGQMQAAKNRLLQSMASSREEAARMYKTWYEDSGAVSAPLDRAHEDEGKDAITSAPSVPSVPAVLKTPPPCLRLPEQSKHVGTKEQPAKEESKPSEVHSLPAVSAPAPTPTPQDRADRATYQPPASVNPPSKRKVAASAAPLVKPSVSRKVAAPASTPADLQSPPTQVKPKRTIQAPSKQTPISKPAAAQSTSKQAVPSSVKQASQSTRSSVHNITKPTPQVKTVTSNTSRPSSASSSSAKGSTEPAQDAKPKKVLATSTAARTKAKKAATPSRLKSPVAPPVPAPAPEFSPEVLPVVPSPQENHRLDGVGGSSRPTTLMGSILMDCDSDHALARELANQDREFMNRSDYDIAREFALQERDIAYRTDAQLAQSYSLSEAARRTMSDREIAASYAEMNDASRGYAPAPAAGRFTHDARPPYASPRQSRRRTDLDEDEDAALARAIMASQLDQ
eukprot:TRINITY_DN16695_c0_g1_i1.p1 TRINITY_DN16695_c0_g1~~TRINITY_DN16695_c0_g1_i1.p1  ORF type:complete len:740 (+),score=117.83 TRINITY_DN16695_c0_g1_i1:34-2220(+)